MLKSKHIKRIRNFKSEQKIKNLLVIVSFNPPISDTKTDDLKPDILAVLRYIQKEGVLTDLKYPQGVNDYKKFRKNLDDKAEAEQKIANHEALLGFF